MNANKLLGIMAERRVSQRMLASMMGVSKNTINAKMNGVRPFDTDEAITICGILGIVDNNTKAEIFLTKSSHN